MRGKKLARHVEKRSTEPMRPGQKKKKAKPGHGPSSSKTKNIKKAGTQTRFKKGASNY